MTKRRLAVLATILVAVLVSAVPSALKADDETKGNAEERPHAITIPLEKKPKGSKAREKAAKAQREKMPDTPAYLDARSAFDYATGHVAGAMSIRWQDYAQTEYPHKGVLDPDLDLLARKLRILGVAPDRQVIVEGGGPQGTGEEGRIAWMLKYLGVKNVVVHNNANEKLRRTTVATEEHWVAPVWTPQIHDEIRIKKSDLQNLVANGRGKVTLIDVRSEQEFNLGQKGEAKSVAPIPGAMNIPWTKFMAANGEMASPEQVRKLLKDRGVDTAKELIFLCALGVRGAYVAFAANRAGLSAVNFDGGLIEFWGK